MHTDTSNWLGGLEMVLRVNRQAVLTSSGDLPEVSDETGQNGQLNTPLNLSETLDTLVDPFLVLSNQGQVLYLNKAATALFGSSKPKVLGKNPAKFFYQYNPLFVQYFDQAVQTMEPVHFEVELQNTWYEVHYYPTPEQLSVQFHDISNSKHLESELQQSLYRFKASVDNMLDSFVILSTLRDESGLIKDFVIDFINRIACSMLRRKPEDIVGKSLFRFYPGHRNSSVFADYIRVVETGKPLSLESVYYEDKSVSGYFDVQAVKMGDGIAVSWRDVTDRHMTDEALRLSEERFYKAFQLNPATMSISRVSDGSYIDVNQRWVEATGYTAAEAIGSNSTTLGLWVADSFCRDFRKAFHSHDALKGMEVKVKNKSGRILTGHLSSEIIIMNGEPCFLTVFQDITEKRLIEENLARLDRLNLIGQTAASIGHEIRNPLTSVRGFLQMMGETTEGAQFKDYFDIIIEELDRANFILSEFLLLAKDKAIDLRPHNLNSIITAIYPLLQADANRLEMTVELQLVPVPILNLDDKEIRQLVCNLARNGLEAMEPGGNLVISTNFKDHHVVLSVKDSGRGIAPEIQEKLGTPFVTDKDGGAGLGLAVCYSIAARHHADLSFDTGPGGTTFTLNFKPIEPATWRFLPKA
jgi:two-component system, sporulation sensor kinase E